MTALLYLIVSVVVIVAIGYILDLLVSRFIPEPTLVKVLRLIIWLFVVVALIFKVFLPLLGTGPAIDLPS